MKRVLFLFLLITPSLATSKGVISPGLQAQLDSLPAQGVVEAFLVVKNRAPIGLLKASLKKASRQELHTEIVISLKETARLRQGGLLDFLEKEKKAGRVFNHKSYWIDNLILVRTTKAELLQLAEQPDVVEIYENPRLKLVEPFDEIIVPASTAVTLKDTGRAEPGLVAIGCRQMWKKGLTGKGRLIGSLDTGIDGNHRALKSRWRGRKPGVTHQEAWFDPVLNLTVPHTFSRNLNHGTHVLGIACGLDTSRTINGTDTTLFIDTLGVAPEAEWISAAVIDVNSSFVLTNGSHVLDALEWAADPDGDPNTIEDVPDAVNNSWVYPTIGAGNNMSCHPFFYQAIDNVEAAGVVVVFAAGNNGPASRTIGNPADRGTSPFSSFAVGNFDLDSVHTDPANPDSVTAFFGKIYSGIGASSRGPTECGPDSLKPEVSAPGTGIYSALAFNQFGMLTGTSMAAPHITGAVALLRQYNPNASVDTIKWVLANSATDIGPVGPDTISGYGVINLPKALLLMPPNQGIHLYVKKDKISDSLGQPPYSNGRFNIYLNLTNNGVDAAYSVFGKLSATDGNSTVISDSSSFGNLPPGDTASNSGRVFKIQTMPGLITGQQIHFNLALFGSGGFVQNLSLSFTIGERLAKTIYHHRNGNVEFTVSNFGAFGFEPGGLEVRSRPGADVGLGFERKSEPGASRLFEASFMVGVNDSMVSNTASNEFCCLPAPDADFAVHPGGNLHALEPGFSGGNETFSIYDDRWAKYPMDLTISQRSFSFETPGYDNFVLLEFIMKNEGGQTLSNLNAGLYFDINFYSSLGSQIGEKAGFDRSFDLGYQFNEVAPAYRGIASADTGKLSSFKTVSIFPTVIDGFTLVEKWQFLTSGFTDTAITTVVDATMLAAKGPFTLQPNDSVKIAFALVAATNLDSLKTYTQTAQTLYQIITSTKGDLNGDQIFTPADIVLHLNCVFLSLGNCPLNQLDLNCDGMATIEDVVILLNRVFLGILPPCA